MLCPPSQKDCSSWMFMFWGHRCNHLWLCDEILFGFFPHPPVTWLLALLKNDSKQFRAKTLTKRRRKEENLINVMLQQKVWKKKDLLVKTTFIKQQSNWWDVCVKTKRLWNKNKTMNEEVCDDYCWANRAAAMILTAINATVYDAFRQKCVKCEPIDSHCLQGSHRRLIERDSSTTVNKVFPVFVM